MRALDIFQFTISVPSKQTFKERKYAAVQEALFVNDPFLQLIAASFHSIRATMALLVQQGAVEAAKHQRQLFRYIKAEQGIKPGAHQSSRTPEAH